MKHTKIHCSLNYSYFLLLNPTSILRICNQLYSMNACLFVPFTFMSSCFNQCFDAILCGSGGGGLLKGEANQMIKTQQNAHGVVQKAVVQKLIKSRVLSKVRDQFAVQTGPD